jgi:hypothetical protein
LKHNALLGGFSNLVPLEEVPGPKVPICVQFLFQMKTRHSEGLEKFANGFQTLTLAFNLSWRYCLIVIGQLLHLHRKKFLLLPIGRQMRSLSGTLGITKQGLILSLKMGLTDCNTLGKDVKES